jgi:murein DD-endopeptidase MepM/ murein hydrolase activator NlpD
LTLTGSTPTPAEAAGHLLNLPVEEVRRRFAATYGRTPSPPPAPPAANAPAPHTMDWWGQRLQSGEPLFSYEEGLRGWPPPTEAPAPAKQPAKPPQPQPTREQIPVGALPIKGTILPRGRFGTRQSFRCKNGRMSSSNHLGVDISVPEGTRLPAIQGGTVISAGWSGGYGNQIVIDAGNGRRYSYNHLSSIAVHPGQTVTRGMVVGRVGQTGNATGPHLHYEIRINGTPVNPLTYKW